jgi:septal ring factor EnvC (AmiA/AmiB activator)
MNKLIVSIVGAGAVAMLAGCGGVSEVTKERVARSETVVQQAQQTVGNSEAGAIELQKAKETLEAAQRELSKENAVAAERFASQAQLTAELAVAKSQSSQARKAADELLASIETLRQEAARGSGGSTTGGTTTTTPETR